MGIQIANGKIKYRERFFTTQNITKIAVLSAISVILYMFIKFPLPFIFPSFFDIQISEMPALLGGFMMGPVAGCAIVIVKCLIKLPFSSTFGVGELSDILIGLAFVLPSALIYNAKKTKKSAALGLTVGGVSAVGVAVIINAFIIIPAYIQLMFKGSWSPLLNMMSILFKDITKDNFFAYYLPLSVLPFNILRSAICGFTAFILYKKVKKLFEVVYGGKSAVTEHAKKYNSSSADETKKIAIEFSKTLHCGDIVTLSGELGAGKTLFSKGVGEALGIVEPILSPTFTIMNEYDGRVKLYHFDAYRLSGADEAVEAGLSEYIGKSDGITLIEWSENISEILENKKVKTVKIKITNENSREIEIND